MPENVEIRSFIEKYQGKTVHLANGTSVRFTNAAAETALHLLRHRLPADDGGYHDVFPSIARLAEMAGKTERAIQMRLVQLERIGLIRRISRFRSDGRSTSNVYIFAIPAVLFQKQRRPAVDEKYQVKQHRISSPPTSCDPAVSLSQARFTPQGQKPFTLKGDVDLKRSTTSDPTYSDQLNHNTITPKPPVDTDVVVFCNRFKATAKQKEALLRAVRYYGLEIVKEAITIAMTNITTVKLPFNYVIGTAARIAQKNHYLAELQLAKEQQKQAAEREEIILKACYQYRNVSRCFDSARALAVAILDVIEQLRCRPDQRTIIEDISRRILIPSQAVA
jgi:hypothetical protein